VAKYGDVSVELDALPIDVLQGRIRSEVEARMDIAALERTKADERRDIERIAALLNGKAE
jgi:hypothetical protein